MNDAIARDLTTKVTQAIKSAWPALVASELMKLQGQTKTRRTDISKEALLAQCLKLKAKGKSQAEIARELNTSQPHVSRLLNGNGKRAARREPTLKAALTRYGSRTKAAKALGIPRQTFSDRLAKES